MPNADAYDLIVIGAGPAGLEAARVAAARGHEVVVFEAGDRPGGRLTMSQSGILASYDYLDSTVDAVKELRDAGFDDVTTYAAYPEHHLEDAARGGRVAGAGTLIGVLGLFPDMEWTLFADLRDVATTVVGFVVLVVAASLVVPRGGALERDATASPAATPRPSTRSPPSKRRRRGSIGSSCPTRCR